MKKRFLTMVALMLSLAIALPFAVCAIDPSVNEVAKSISITREQAATLLGISADEMDDFTFYVLDNNADNSGVSIQAIEVPNDGTPVTVDAMAVHSGINYGGNFKISGNRIVWTLSAVSMNVNNVAITGTLNLYGWGPQKSLSAYNDQTVNSGFFDIQPGTCSIEYIVPSGASGYAVSLVACYTK